MIVTLLQIEAPHFVAGVELQDGRVTLVAPILGWARGIPEGQLRAYCQRKRWRVYEIKMEAPRRA
ncbi:hypothetical protein [Collimonas fungivorans]|uniref:hypothetical protein n=1 Tax=Collimonas fungivorans TaxID=158899 RepID=UPI003FA3B9D5